MWLFFDVLISAVLSIFAGVWIIFHLRKHDSSNISRPMMVTAVSYIEVVVGMLLVFFAVLFMLADVLSPTGQGIAFAIGMLFFIPAALLTVSGILLYKQKPARALTLHLVTLLPLLGLTYLQAEAFGIYKDAGNLWILVVCFLLLGISLLGCLASFSLTRSKAK